MCGKPKAPKQQAPAKDPAWKTASPTDTANRGEATTGGDAARRVADTSGAGELGTGGSPLSSVLGG